MPRALKVLLSFGALAVAACKDEAPAPHATSSAASSTPAASSSGAPIGSSMPAVTTSAAPTTPVNPAAPGPAPTPEPFVESPEPALAEWATSRIVTVRGSSRNACDTRMVREWLRVQCVPRSDERGTPRSIELTRGRSEEHFQGENLKAVNDITTLLVPVRPGIDLEASFTWEKGADTLKVSWPTGALESERVMAFTSADAEGGSPVVSGSAIAPPASAPASAPPAPPLPDVPDLKPPPSEDEWSKAPEARVSGSTAAQCETKVVGDWFRARCAPGTVIQIVPISGHRTTQTKLVYEAAGAALVTPYVEETELHVRFEKKTDPVVLVLRWPKGPRPAVIGAFESPR